MTRKRLDNGRSPISCTLFSRDRIGPGTLLLALSAEVKAEGKDDTPDDCECASEHCLACQESTARVPYARGFHETEAIRREESRAK